MNRDGGDAALASDWFLECDIGTVDPATVDFVGLFIDESGSMTGATVAASLADFEADMAAAGLTITRVNDPSENWINACDTTLAPMV